MPVDKKSMLTCIDDIIRLLLKAEQVCRRGTDKHSCHTSCSSKPDRKNVQDSAPFAHDTPNRSCSSQRRGTITSSTSSYASSSVGQLHMRVAVCIMNFHLNHLIAQVRVLIGHNTQSAHHRHAVEGRGSVPCGTTTDTTPLHRSSRGPLDALRSARAEHTSCDDNTPQDSALHPIPPRVTYAIETRSYSPYRGTSTTRDTHRTDPRTFTRAPVAASSPSSFFACFTPTYDCSDAVATPKHDTWRPNLFFAGPTTPLGTDSAYVHTNMEHSYRIDPCNNSAGRRPRSQTDGRYNSISNAATAKNGGSGSSSDTLGDEHSRDSMPRMTDLVWSYPQTPCRCGGMRDRHKDNAHDGVRTGGQVTEEQRTPHAERADSVSPSLPESAPSSHVCPQHDHCSYGANSDCTHAARQPFLFAMSVCYRDTRTGCDEHDARALHLITLKALRNAWAQRSDTAAPTAVLPDTRVPSVPTRTRATTTTPSGTHTCVCERRRASRPFSPRQKGTANGHAFCGMGANETAEDLSACGKDTVGGAESVGFGGADAYKHCTTEDGYPNRRANDPQSGSVHDIRSTCSNNSNNRRSRNIPDPDTAVNHEDKARMGQRWGHAPHRSALFTCNSRGFAVSEKGHARACSRAAAPRSGHDSTRPATQPTHAMQNTNTMTHRTVPRAHTACGGRVTTAQAVAATASAVMRRRPCPQARPTLDAPSHFHLFHEDRAEHSCDGVGCVAPRSYSATVRPPVSPGHTRSDRGGGDARRRSSRNTSMHRDTTLLLQSESDDNDEDATHSNHTPSPTRRPYRCCRSSTCCRTQRENYPAWDAFGCGGGCNHSHEDNNKDNDYACNIRHDCSSYTNPYHSRLATVTATTAAAVTAPRSTSSTLGEHTSVTDANGRMCICAVDEPKEDEDDTVTNPDAAVNKESEEGGCTVNRRDGARHARRVKIHCSSCPSRPGDDGAGTSSIPVSRNSPSAWDTLQQPSQSSSSASSSHVNRRQPSLCEHAIDVNAEWTRSDPRCLTETVTHYPAWLLHGACALGGNKDMSVPAQAATRRGSSHTSLPGPVAVTTRQASGQPPPLLTTATRVVHAGTGVSYEIQPAVLRSFVSAMRALAAHYAQQQPWQSPTWAKQRIEAMHLCYAIYGVRVRPDSATFSQHELPAMNSPVPFSSSSSASSLSPQCGLQAMQKCFLSSSHCNESIFALPLIDGGETCAVTLRDFPFFVQLIEQKAQELTHDVWKYTE